MLKSAKSKFALMGAAVSGAATQAYAAVPTGVKEGIEGAAKDATDVGGYVIVAAAALFAIFMILRVLR